MNIQCFFITSLVPLLGATGPPGFLFFNELPNDPPPAALLLIGVFSFPDMLILLPGVLLAPDLAELLPPVPVEP